jgi:hypothetical protein
MRAMNHPAILLILLAALCNITTGFRAFAKPTSIQTLRHASKQDVTRRVSTFEELIQAFIEAIPSVLRPPKEMDKTKVIEDPPKFLKVWSGIALSTEHACCRTYDMTFQFTRRPLQAASVKYTRERTNGTSKKRSTIFSPSFSQLRRTGVYSNNPLLEAEARIEMKPHLVRHTIIRKCFAAQNRHSA